MEASCARALELGLPAIAFTDHADFTERVTRRGGRLNTLGYHDCIQRCRELFPGLRILSGVELGEPHRFPDDTAAILRSGPFDLVLGSVHCAPVGGELTDASGLGLLRQEAVPAFFRSYLAETLALVQSDIEFEVLTHLDYPKRYWPHEAVAYDERDYEEAFRAVLGAAARRSLVLEVNTTRGMDSQRGLCPGPVVLGWWVEEGGTAVSVGSDAHDSSMLTMGFETARDMLERAGFTPPDAQIGFWTCNRRLAGGAGRSGSRTVVSRE